MKTSVNETPSAHNNEPGWPTLPAHDIRPAAEACARRSRDLGPLLDRALAEFLREQAWYAAQAGDYPGLKQLLPLLLTARRLQLLHEESERAASPLSSPEETGVVREIFGLRPIDPPAAAGTEPSPEWAEPGDPEQL